ncbi:MAG: AI-2E family transporter [Candidatus Levybacteria bacterium]|nr:AI-2E family transporter [Candidatus Levybacteria bacterium]
MTIRLRTAFYLGLTILALWFIYIGREILIPFILAGIFAYIFNPVVNFFSNRIKLSRSLSIIIIYLIIVSIFVVSSLFLVRQIIDESSELKNLTNNLLKTTKSQIETLPYWLKPTAQETISSLEKSRIFLPLDIFSFFPGAISRIVSFFIFLFSGFYFLKEGKSMIDKLLNFVPKNHRIDVEILLFKINSVLGAYLRGQILIVAIVSLMLFVALSILGVRFSLILAIFSGFAEIVPIIGPIVAGGVAALVVLVTGTVNFSLTPIYGALVVAVVYFVIRQFQDYFINPYVMGKITKLHPLIILFAVLAGGHVWSLLGVILAVPIAAIIKILLEFSVNKINEQTNKK